MNPYLTLDACVARLVREHAKHPRLCIAVDFDDTIFNYHDKDFSLEANELNHAVVLNLLRECYQRGFYLTIFTASVPERFPMMLDYCKLMGFEAHSINKNAVENLPFGNHGKVYYNILLDDRAGLGSAVETLRLFLATLPPISA